jgi:Trk-type K+ transport system membrane component
MALEDRSGLLNDALMPPQSHRSGRRWRRFLRHNPQFKFILFFVVIIILLVAGLMVLITSPDFVKPR